MSGQKRPLSGWGAFAEKHPAAAKWIREGGLFVIVCNLITVLKYFILQFLPYAFTDLAGVEFGWPGIPLELFGQSFNWNIFGYAVKYEAGEVVVGGGLGEAVCAVIAQRGLACPVCRVGVNDEFGHSGPAGALMEQFGLCAEHIAAQV